MKNIFFVVLAFLFTSLFFGQDANNKLKTRFGVFLGANRLTNPGKEKFFEGSDFNADIGFQFGLNVNIPISNKVSFQPEIAFQRIGYSFKGLNNSIRFDPIGSSSENIFYSNYIQIPLLFKFSFSKKINLDLGSHFGALVYSKNTNINVIKQNDGTFKTFEYVYENSGRNFIYGINIGLNFNIHKNFYINLRNTLIIVEGASLTETFNNGILALNGGYRFN